jgi:hypothetical protein
VLINGTAPDVACLPTAAHNDEHVRVGKTDYLQSGTEDTANVRNALNKRCLPWSDRGVTGPLLRYSLSAVRPAG